MKKGRLRAAAAVLALALCVTVPVHGGNEATDATVRSYEDQIADVVRKQEEAMANLEKIRTEQQAVWVELAAYDELIALNREKKRLAEGQLDSLEEQIESKETDIQTKEELIEKQKEAFLNRMVTVYEDGDAGYLELLLGAEDLIEFLTRMDRVLIIMENDREIVDGLQDSKARLEQDRVALKEAQEKMDAAVKEYEKTIAEDEKIYQMKLDRQAELNDNEQESLEEYNYQKSQEDELNAQLQTYLEELQRRTQSVYVGGSLAWPLDPSAGYYYSSAFGGRNLWGAYDFHLGLDIACARNTHILAANAGTVVVSASHYSYGEYVVVDHGGGMATLYAHMTERAVSVGDQVSVGQLIGYVGMTGSASGYHLHFEVRVNGEVQDPTAYISGPAD